MQPITGIWGKRQIWILPVICLVLPACKTTQPVQSLRISGSTERRIDSLCQSHLAAHHYPGLAVAVMRDGKHLWMKGYGYADIRTLRPVDPAEDLFRIGSVSKTVTAAALARLYQKHRIDLDIPVSRYYPEIPKDKANLTLRQLGGHLAGIRHYLGLEFFSQIHFDHVDEALEVFIHDSLLFVPGTRYSYSTYGWTLISAVMEKATGKPFSQLVHQEVNKPMKLTDLKPDLVDSVRYRRVGFYEWKDSTLLEAPRVDNSNKWAGGGMLCTADDLARFGSGLISSRYLKPDVLERFTTSQATTDGTVTHYGIGVTCGTDDQGMTWFGHSGGSIGGTSMLYILPEDNLVVVTLINLTGADMDRLARKIANVLKADDP